nr:gramicidin S synthase 2 [uncultured bacterium]
MHCPRQILLDPAALADLIRREGIECLEVVPAFADALAAHLEGQGDHLDGVCILAVGSDTLRCRLYRRLCRLLGPGCRVVNSYGLTETTIDSSCFTGSPEELLLDGQVPIGRPLAGTRAYVLDGGAKPVPAGVVGELYIGGPGVARGYVNRPGQTAERFLPDLHSAPGSRMYATGDRARWREGGVLELLGRQDGQVKIRGIRIEVAEIEAALVRHPGVREAVVMVHEDPLGEKRLTAYVVPALVSDLTTSEMRRWLKDRMPEPMIPSSCVFLEALPLSPNGKLDRSALRPPAMLVGDIVSTEYVPPRTTAEEILAGITADLAGRDRVGIHEHFFEIGIDSIRGIQMVSRARQAGLNLDPTQLFRSPTVAELAAQAETGMDHRGSGGSSAFHAAPFELVPPGIDLEAIRRGFAESGGIEDLYPLTPVQEGMLFHTLADPAAGHYVEQFVCRLRGELDRSALRESWHRLVARHPALRTTVHWTDLGGSYQVIHCRAEHPWDDQDWRVLASLEQDQQLANYLDSDRRRGFIPSRPPLSRLALFRLGEDVHQLVWSIHHVVIDGWCLSVLLHEILHIYEAIRGGREPESKPGRPFRHYLAWLRERDDGTAEEYWRRSLSGFTAATPLGVDGLSLDRRAESSEGVAERRITLSAEMTAMVQALGRSYRLTLSTLIQGAWAVLLSRYSGQDDLVFGVAVSGRPPELAGVESMIGMFINVLPLRIRVIEESQVAPWLRELQATMVELRRFEAIPPSRIQAWSEVPAGRPLFESIVIVQNLPFDASLQERANRLGIESARFLERTHYPIAITVIPGTELELRVGFDADRFDPCTIERALEHLRSILHAMAAHPQQRVADLTSILDLEQEQLNRTWDASHDEPHPDSLDIDRLDGEELDALIAQLQ